MRQCQETNIKLIISFFIAFGLCACDVITKDKDGNQSVSNLFATPDYGLLDEVKNVIKISDEAPTDDGFKQVSKIFETLIFPEKCEGDEKQDYLLAYRAINYMKYDFNNYATADSHVSKAQKFLTLCARESHKALAGPVLVGVGMHGNDVDANTIFQRVLAEKDQGMLVYAAVGLKYVCDPIADQYLSKLADIAKDENVKKAIQTNIENRVFFSSNCSQHGESGEKRR